jgi:5-methylthioribose kinase
LHVDDRSVVSLVRGLEILPSGVPLEVESAGDGNINYVRRVRAPGCGSVVVKHARPTLERFPQYEAPPERLGFEHAYAEAVHDLAPDQAHVLPRVLHFDPDSRLLVLEDLGDAPRLEEEMLGGRFPSEAMGRLGFFLARVHDATRTHARALEPRFRNEGMRSLHGEHIFTLPFEENDFPIPGEVRREAERRLGRSARECISALRERYYGSADALVHADVQPSNILLPEAGPKLLDAEIAHVRHPAFDLGTALAHLRFHLARGHAAAVGRAEQSLLEGYHKGGGRAEDLERAFGYAGVEMLRRTIGAARVRAVEDPAVAMAAISHAMTLL